MAKSLTEWDEATVFISSHGQYTGSSILHNCINLSVMCILFLISSSTTCHAHHTCDSVAVTSYDAPHHSSAS
ncbi:hypothetical protein K440DRAFT_355482 [Wilcoxina mikolae CBS 423.85]|nr:hypothetical protein K440DRAFT_355482 [Wilcoxina mikolae CBS 423.85]